MIQRKVNYQKVYEDIQKAEENRKKYSEGVKSLRKKLTPLNYRDIANKYRISPTLVMKIKRTIENGQSN